MSLTDVFPTVCSLFGTVIPEAIDGESLWCLMRGEKDEKRRDFAFSEYHAHGMPCAMYMIRWKNYKYVHYTEAAPQLFRLSDDPGEDVDLWEQTDGNRELEDVVNSCRKRLYSVCNPDETDMRAREFQTRMKKALGVREGYPEKNAGWVPRPEHL